MPSEDTEQHSQEEIELEWPLNQGKLDRKRTGVVKRAL